MLRISSYWQQRPELLQWYNKFFNNAHVYLYTVALTNRPRLGIDL